MEVSPGPAKTETNRSRSFGRPDKPVQWLSGPLILARLAEERHQMATPSAVSRPLRAAVPRVGQDPAF